MLPDPGAYLLGRQPSHQQVGPQFVVVGAGGAQEDGAVLAPESVGPGPQAGAGCGGLGHEDEVELPVDQ